MNEKAECEEITLQASNPEKKKNNLNISHNFEGKFFSARIRNKFTI
jgi:hypothetical protein